MSAWRFPPPPDNPCHLAANPTAGSIFADLPGIDVDSAGLNRDAKIRSSDEQVRWADLIFVMEHHHRAKLNQRHRRALKGKRTIVLGIPDHYEFMDEELVEILHRKCRPYLPG